MRSINKETSGLPCSLSIALFLVGGELLSVGRESVSEAYSSGIAFAVALLFVGAAASAARAVFGDRASGASKRIFTAILAILAAAASIYVAIDSVLEFSEFVSDVMLLRAPRYLVMLIFLVFCVFLASRGVGTVRKYAFLSAVAVLIGAIALILLSLPSIDTRAIELGGGTPNTRSVAEAFVKKFAPLCIPLVYLSYGQDSKIGEKNSTRLSPLAACVGVLIGGAILTLCHFNVTLLLGSALAREQNFPYSAAMSAVSAGKLFMRMEGISYVLYFLASTLRTSIAVGTVGSLSTRFLKIRGRRASSEAEIAE